MSVCAAFFKTLAWQSANVINTIMKKTTYLSLLLITLAMLAKSVVASTVVLPSPHEPNLLGSGGILDTEFGLANLQRVDDDLDQYWHLTGSDVMVTAVAKYAGYKQDFGYIDSNDVFTSLLYVPYMDNQTNSFNIADSGSPIRFGLDPSGSPLFSSASADNVFCGWFFCTSEADHMVSWLITDGQYAGDYVVAWEDLKKLGDRDYNDLVVRVSGVTVVPVPAAVWLFGSGLIGLAMAARRRTH